jgi:hypothetical protein
MSGAFDADAGSGPRGTRVLRPVAMRPAGGPSTAPAGGFDARAPASYQNSAASAGDALFDSIKRDILRLNPLILSTRKYVEQIGTRLDTIELRKKM